MLLLLPSFLFYGYFNMEIRHIHSSPILLVLYLCSVRLISVRNITFPPHWFRIYSMVRPTTVLTISVSYRFSSSRVSLNWSTQTIIIKEHSSRIEQFCNAGLLFNVSFASLPPFFITHFAFRLFCFIFHLAQFPYTVDY